MFLIFHIYVIVCSNVSAYTRGVYADIVFAILLRSLDGITILLFFVFWIHSNAFHF